MTRKGLYDKLTPEHLGLEQGYDEAAFTVLKDGLKWQWRDAWKFPVFMLGGLLFGFLLSTVIGGFVGNMLSVVSIIAGAILANLSMRRSTKAVKQALQCLGIKQKDVNTALRNMRQAERHQTGYRLKKEAGYISPWMTFGFYAGLTLLFISFVSMPFSFLHISTAVFLISITLSIIGITATAFCLLFRQKAVWIVAAAMWLEAFIGLKGVILPLILILIPYLLLLLLPVYLYIGKAVKFERRPPDLRKFWLYAAPVLALVVYALLIVVSVVEMAADSDFSLLMVSLPFCCAAGVAGVYLFCKKKKLLPGIVLVLLPPAFCVLQSVVVADNRIEWEVVYILLAPFILLLSLLPLTRKRKSDNLASGKGGIKQERNMKKIFILTALLAATVGPAMGQSKEAKEAIAYAEQFDFPTPPIRSLEYCYIVLEKGICARLTTDYIYVTDDSILHPRPVPPNQLKWDCEGLIVPRGIVSLSVRYYKKRQEYTGIVSNSMSTMLKADSVYKISVINDKENSYRAIFTPATAPEELALGQAALKKHKEERNRFLNYQAQNPNRLEGKWKGEKKKMMNAYFMEYHFSGDKLRFESKFKSFNNGLFTVEGTMIYSENILVFFPKQAFYKGKKLEELSAGQPYIWYYSTDGGVLHLEGGKKFKNSMTFWENTGTFHRVTSDTENQ